MCGSVQENVAPLQVDRWGCPELLRRSAAEALLIQNLEFQTIKCPSVRPSVKICLSGKTEQNTEWYLRRLQWPISLGLFFSRFSRCRKKLRFANEGTICRDPKKVDFFYFLIMKIFDFLIMKKK